MTVPLPKIVYEEVNKNRNLVLETSIDDEGNIVISSLDEDDFNSYVCDNECENCPLFNEEKFKCMKTNKFDINKCLKTDCSDCNYCCETCGGCTFDE
jgi:hypothetical protein